MTERPRYTIALTVVDNYGSGRWTRAVDSDEFPIFDDRFVSELKFSPSLALGPSKDAGEAMSKMAEVLHKREFRKHILRDAAAKLAHQLAEYLEDLEGWHGEDRQVRLLEQRKKDRGY